MKRRKPTFDEHLLCAKYWAGCSHTGMVDPSYSEAIEFCWVEPLAEAYTLKLWWGLDSWSSRPDSEACIVSLPLLQVDEMKGVCMHTCMVCVHVCVHGCAHAHVVCVVCVCTMQRKG